MMSWDTCKGFLNITAASAISLWMAMFSLYSCRKDEPSRKSCCDKEISDLSIERFESSAYSFAYEEISKDSTYKSSFIDESIYSCYLGKLSSIYNSILPSDSSYYKLIHSTSVHREAEISLRDIVIKFDSAQLKNQFISDPQSFDNDYLKSLLNELDFDIYPWIWDPVQARIWSNNYYNIPYLIDSLVQTPGIDSAYAIINPPVDAYNHVDLVKVDGSYQFDFFYGWSDLSAQEYFHSWRIIVSDYCEVTLIGDSGDPLP